MKNKPHTYYSFYIILILYLSLFSCDIFNTREPEEPSDNATALLPQNSEDNLLTNFTSALKELNSVNYLNTLSDLNNSNSEFSFTPSGLVYQNYHEIFQFWSKEDENNFILNLNSKTSDNKMNLIFQNQKWSYQLDSTILEAEYLITIAHTFQVPTFYKGKLQLIMKKNDNNIWHISRWIDFSTHDSLDNITFSNLKVNFK